MYIKKTSSFYSLFEQMYYQLEAIFGVNLRKKIAKMGWGGEEYS